MMDMVGASSNAGFAGQPRPRGGAEGSAEADLVRRAAHDSEAFGALYRRHYPAIQRYLRRRLGDSQVVEDAVAETFMTPALLPR